ncbi:MAG: ATP-dependent RecD-like DNA helicase [Bdellovibrionota bacterium]
MHWENEKNITKKEETVEGYIKRIRFQNEENGFSILVVEDEEAFEDVIVTGTSFTVYEGCYIVASGYYVVHPKFGKQLKASSILETIPSDVKGVEKYLSSGILPGVGEKTAQKIVGLLGKNAVEKIIEDPLVLKNIKGLSKKKIDSIYNILLNEQNAGKALRFLIEHNISTALANLIFQKYGEKSIEIVSNDPYRLCLEISGIGFIKADDIAFKMGFEKNDRRRIKAGISYTLEKATQDGHCYLEESVLKERAKQLLELDEDIASIDVLIDELTQEDILIRRDKNILLKEFDEAENFISKYIIEKSLVKDLDSLSEKFIDAVIPRIELSQDIKYSDEQVNAIKSVNKNKVLLITGGPGSGKTTIINGISKIFLAAGKTVKLAAPTGKAAQRLSSVCGISAQTIHRLLRYDPINQVFLHNLEKPIQADIFIIDECSMIDILLAKSLLEAIPRTATLVMVGDKDQLPPVGPGRVFADLLELESVPRIFLSQIFRRSEASNINQVAFNINKGLTPSIPIPDGNTKSDIFFIPKESPFEISNLIEKLVSYQIPNKFGFSLDDIMVLTPMNKGPLGTTRLNNRLQSIINPIEALGSEQEILVNDTSFRLNDRVCQRVNNYQLGKSGVFNGDTGIITRVNSITQTLRVRLWDEEEVEYQKNNLAQLQLAYALSVHRSQGSEIPCVVLALHSCHYTLLERQLIYTAITRAKNLLIIVGQMKALNYSIKNQQAIKRNSMLIEKTKALAMNTSYVKFKEEIAE